MANSLKTKGSKVKVDGMEHRGCPGFLEYSFRTESADVRCNVEVFTCNYCGDRFLYIRYLSWWERFKRFFS